APRNNGVLPRDCRPAPPRCPHESRPPGTGHRAARLPSARRRTRRRRFVGHPRRAARAPGHAVEGPPDRSADEVAAYLALAQVPGIGSARLRTLVAAFETAVA